MDLLIINGHDYSKFVLQNGYGWARNDLDSDKSTRTKDGTMRRVKITEKRKLSYTLYGMTREQLAQLDDDLRQTTFTATFMDLHGKMTRKFYCSGISASLNTTKNSGANSWTVEKFDITEV